MVKTCIFEILSQKGTLVLVLVVGSRTKSSPHSCVTTDNQQPCSSATYKEGWENSDESHNSGAHDANQSDDRENNDGDNYRNKIIDAGNQGNANDRSHNQDHAREDNPEPHSVKRTVNMQGGSHSAGADVRSCDRLRQQNNGTRNINWHSNLPLPKVITIFRATLYLIKGMHFES